MSDQPVEPEIASKGLPYVPSPYAGIKLSVRQHLKISAYWFATNFLWGALLTIMLPAEAKHMAPQYRVTALAILTGLSAVVALFVPLVAGALSDRCSHPLGRRRPYIAAGVAINVAGLFLMHLTYRNSGRIMGDPHANTGEIFRILITNPSFYSFLLAFMVVQFGNNVASAAYSGIIPDLIPEDQRGTASGYMALMSQAGTLLGAVGCGLLLSNQSESVKYLLLSTVITVVAGITVLGVRETPLPFKPPPIKWGEYVKSLWIDPRKYPDFAWVWITRALVMLGFYSVLPFINYYLTDVIGIEKPEMAASKLIGIILVASSVSGIYGGMISDRVGRKRVVYIANSLIAVMALVFIGCRNMEQVLLVGVLFGLGFGAYTSVDWALGTDVLPSKVDAAKEMAVWHIAMTLPQSIAAPVAGSLIAIFGVSTLKVEGETVYHYPHAGYALVFVMASACFGLGAYFLKNVRGVK
jgi:MFS family permease